MELGSLKDLTDLNVKLPRVSQEANLEEKMLLQRSYWGKDSLEIIFFEWSGYVVVGCFWGGLCVGAGLFLVIKCHQ